MPTLEKAAYEVYARARVAGLGRVDASVKAGYCADHSSASRVERRPEVAARIAELRLRDPDNAAPGAIMARLLRLADVCDALGTVPAVKEGRLALLEAHRLQMELAERQEEEGYGELLPPQLTEEQWIVRYGRPEDRERVLSGEWRFEDGGGWRAEEPAAALSKNGS